MKIPHIAFLLLSFAVANLASAATKDAPSNPIRSNTTIAAEDGGKMYHVEVSVAERSPDGSSVDLPSMGVVQKFGLPAKAEQTVKSGAIHMKLETTSEPGKKTVQCRVSINRANAPAIESEFILTLP